VQIIGFAFFELALAAVIILLSVSSLIKNRGANVRRYISVFTGVCLAALLSLYLFYVGRGDAAAGFTDIVLLSFANVMLFTILVQVALYAAPYQRWSITIVDAGYYAADTAIGLWLFLVLFLLAIVQVIDSLQALLLFSGELLTESRKGSYLRLFDEKRGTLGGAGGSVAPAVPIAPPPGAGPGSGAPPPRDDEPKHNPVALVPPGDAPPMYPPRYSTISAQQTTLGNSARLRRGPLMERRAGRAGFAPPTYQPDI
jgi:hypothetical protein